MSQNSGLKNRPIGRLTEALAEDELPEGYEIDPASDPVSAEGVSVAEAEAAYAVVTGAANADELVVADLFTWTVADTLENLEGAEAAVIDGAASYTLADDAGDLGALTVAQANLVADASNAADFTYSVPVATGDVESISATGPVTEGNDIAFTVTVAEAVNVDRTVDYVIEGVQTSVAGAADPLADVGQIEGTVTIPAGSTTATLPLTPNEDGLTEGREAFVVKLLNSDNSDSVATSNTVVIQDPANAGRNITLTTDVDTIDPSAGNDTLTGSITGIASGEDEELGGTLSTLDSINTGANSYDILRINDTTTMGGADGVNVNEDIAGLQIENVNEFRIRSANDFTMDSTDFAGTELLDVRQGDAITLTAAADTAIQVGGIQKGGSVTLTDGSTQTIDLTREDVTVDVEGAAGAVSVTSADQGAGTIAINDGTDVTVEATADNGTAPVSAGAINIGQTGTQQASGAVNVTQNLNSDGTGGLLEGSAISVKGGTTVDVTVNATSDVEAADSDEDITIGAINVTGDDNTTDVTVTQNASANEVTEPAEGAKTETASVKFGALKKDASLEVAGLTFTASKDLTAAEVAQAFSELTKTDTQDAGGPVTNGVYSGITSGWTSGEANGDTVVFTSTTEDKDVAALPTDLTNGGDSTAPVVTPTDGAEGTGGGTSGNEVNYGAVTIADGGDDSITNVAVSGYAASTIDANVLETLSLTNSDGTMGVTTNATALDVTVDDVDDLVNLDASGASVTDLTLNSQGGASTFDLFATATQNLTVNADAALDIDATGSGSLGTGVEAVDINGSASVDIDDISGAAGLNSFNAADNTGGVTATVETDATTLTGDIAEYVFSAGDDTVTLDSTNNDVDVAVSLGAGDDTVNLASGTTALNAMIDGGADTDTLAMDAADAVTASAGTAFQENFQNIEKLSLGKATAVGTVDLANMDNIDYVVSANSDGGLKAEAQSFTVSGSSAAAATPEQQTIDFTGLAAATAGTISVGGVEVTVAANDTATEIAGKVQTTLAALADDSVLSRATVTDDSAGTVTVEFDPADGDQPALTVADTGTATIIDVSTPASYPTAQEAVKGDVGTTTDEEQTIDFADLFVTADGDIDVGGVSVPVTAGMDGTAIAGAVETALAADTTLSTPAADVKAISADGSVVTVSFAATDGNVDPVSVAGDTATVGAVTTAVASDATVTDDAQAYDSSVGDVTVGGVTIALTAGMTDQQVAAAIAAGDFTGTAIDSVSAEGNEVTVTYDPSLADKADISFAAGTTGVTRSGVTDEFLDVSALTLDNMADDGTVELTETGAGINVNMVDASGAADSLNVKVTNEATVSAGIVNAEGVETINVESNDIFTDTTPEDGEDDNVAQHTLTVGGNDATNVVVTGNGNITLTAESDSLEQVNASTMTGELTYVATVADSEVLAGEGDDTLTANASDVTLNGGDGDDELIVNADADRVELFGGEGKDTFVVNGASSSSSTYAIIRDINAGDKIAFAEAGSFKQAEVTLSEGATESTQALATQAVKDLSENDLGWFQFGGNTFIVQDGGTDTTNESFENGVDKILMINGEVDLSTASFNDDIVGDTSGAAWLEIA